MSAVENPDGIELRAAGQSDKEPESNADPTSETDGPAREPQEPFALEITDVLDLHQFQPREIAEVVKTYLEEARNKRFPSVRIIHGKGTGTQREIVRSVLKKTSFVTSYQDAPAEAGGWGATIVSFSK